jgi:hypothetical protein
MKPVAPQPNMLKESRRKLELDRTAVSPEALARYFHEEYERLAPDYGYETRKESAVPWIQVPENNRELMIAVAASILERFFDGP